MDQLQAFVVQNPVAFPQDVNQHTWMVPNLFYSTSIDYSGERFRQLNLEHHHFIRDSTRQLMRYLNQQFARFDTYKAQHNEAVANEDSPDRMERLGATMPIARIVGASGSGKTTEVFGWLQCQQGGKIFIHSDSRAISTPANITLMGSAVPGGVNMRGLDLDISTIRNLLNSNEVTARILVLDGAFHENVVRSFLRIAFDRKWFVVTCTSGHSLPIRPDALRSLFSFGLHPIHGREIAYLVVNGFTLAEYAQASTLLDTEVTYGFDDILDESRTERFYYAGGSARYYFHYSTIDKLKVAIDERISGLKDFRNFFTGGDGEASEHTSNSLSTFIDGQLTIVSEYASKCLARKVDSEFVHAALKIMHNNPSWQEWVAELDLLHRVQNCASNNLTWEVRYDLGGGLSSIGWRLRIDSYIEYDALTSLEAHRPSFNSIKANSMVYFFAPQKWNNWGFDGMLLYFCCSRKKRQVRIRPYVHILQCTIAENHTKLLENAAAFLNALFPLQDAHNTYALPTQQGFDLPYIRYNILTRRAKFEKHKLKAGRVNGVDQIRRWHGEFSLRTHAKKYYFDDDCSYVSPGNNLVPDEALYVSP